MSRRPLPHAHHAFVLLDPVQDYEETITILGVYGSLAAAKAALPAHRARKFRDGGIYEYDPERVSHIEHRAGDALIDVWEYSPNPKRVTWRRLSERERSRR